MCVSRKWCAGGCLKVRDSNEYSALNGCLFVTRNLVDGQKGSGQATNNRATGPTDGDNDWYEKTVVTGPIDKIVRPSNTNSSPQ